MDLTRSEDNRTGSISVLMFDVAFPPPVLGGKEKQASLLSNALAHAGVCVEAVGFDFPGAREKNQSGVPVERINGNSITKILRLILSLWRRRTRFSIIHIHTPSRVGMLTALISKTFGYKVIFKIPNQGFFDSDEIFSKWTLLGIIVDIFIVLEVDSYNKISHRKFVLSKVLLVKNGVDISVPQRTTTGPKTFDLLYLGRIVPQKRVEDAIYVVKSLGEEGHKFRLNIIGEGSEDYVKKLMSLCSTLGIVDRVKFHGFSEDPSFYLQNSFALILLSEKEGMSNAVLEAMAHGLPIISTRAGAIIEQLGSYSRIYSAEIGDIASFRENIKKLFESSADWEDYSRYIRIRCEQEFSIENISKIYINIYEQVLKVN